jgi:hypothetical protein
MTESREKLAISGPKASGMKLNKIIANHEYAGLAANPRPSPKNTGENRNNCDQPAWMFCNKFAVHPT